MKGKGILLAVAASAVFFRLTPRRSLYRRSRSQRQKRAGGSLAVSEPHVLVQ